MTLAPLALAANELPLGIPAEGAAFLGELSSADASWKLHFKEDNAARDIGAADLALWGGFVEPARGVHIVLPAGGLIVAESAKIEKEVLQAQSATFGSVAIPLELVAAVVFRPPFDRAKGDQLLARVATPGGQTDRVLLDNGDELTGSIAALDDRTLGFQTEVGKVDLEVGKLSAIAFNPTLVKQTQPRGLRSWVGFRDGSRVMAAKLSTEKTTATLEMPGGVKLTAPIKDIVALLPLGGRVDYLSDMKPASYRHIPFLQLTWPFANDRSVLGGLLRVGGKPYLKGLGMHSPSRITYDLARPCRRFEAEAAIDDDADHRGSAVFRVFVDDGSGAWQERATTEIIRGGQPPTPISVDLSGARRISLLVDYADRGDELDHADWLNARVVR